MPDRLPPTPAQVADTLIAEAPTFHVDGQGRPVTYAASDRLLRLLGQHARPGLVSLETGAGASTAVLCAAGGAHTSISPSGDEADRIHAWCADRGIPTDGHTHHVGTSQDLLPSLDPGPLDLVLIDGDHAFPAPAIDYFYAARWLVEGGIVVVDDVQLWPCAEVADHLAEEHGVTLLHRDARFAAFRLDAGGAAVTSRWWGHQGRTRRLHDRPDPRWRRSLARLLDRG